MVIKKKFMDLLEKGQDLRNKAEVFCNSAFGLADIIEAGRYCTISILWIHERCSME